MQDLLLELLNDGSINVANYLLDNYVKLGMSNDEFLLYLQIKKAKSRGDLFPEMEQLATELGMSNQVLFATIQSLQNKKIMEIKQKRDDDGKLSDYYDFSLMYQKLIRLVESQNQVKQQEQTFNQTQSIFQQIETEFGRALTPIEMEMISGWVNKDHYSNDIVRMALKEAVINQAYSLKYIDRILLSWQKKNLKTAQQVEKYRNNLKNYQYNHSNQTSKNSNQQNNVKIPLIKLTHPDKN